MKVINSILVVACAVCFSSCCCQSQPMPKLRPMPKFPPVDACVPCEPVKVIQTKGAK